MTTLTGQSLAYTTSNILAVDGGLILRDGISTVSNDTIAFTATQFILDTMGPNALQTMIGYSYSVTIQNTMTAPADYINLTVTGVGMTMGPGSSSLIPPQGSQMLTFVVTDIDTPAVTVQVITDRKVMGQVAAVTDTSIPIYDGTTGTVLQSSNVLIDASDNLTGITTATIGPSGTDLVTVAGPGTGTGTGDWTLTLPIDDGVSGQVLSTDGTGATSWIANTSLVPQYISLYGPAAGVAITDSSVTVNVATVSANSATTPTAAAGVITITTPGAYQVTFWSQFNFLNGNGGERSTNAAHISLNATEVTGSRCSCFTREDAMTESGCGKTLIIDCVATDTIEMQVLRILGTTETATVVDNCSLSVLLLA